MTTDSPPASRHNRSAVAPLVGSARPCGYPVSSAIRSTCPTASDRPARSAARNQANAKANDDELRENCNAGAGSGEPTR